MLSSASTEVVTDHRLCPLLHHQRPPEAVTITLAPADSPTETATKKTQNKQKTGQVSESNESFHQVHPPTPSRGSCLPHQLAPVNRIYTFNVVDSQHGFRCNR